MAQNSKRYGLIFDRDSCPLPDEWPIPDTPELTNSPASSVQSVEESNASSLADSDFGSFYFSTNDENFDEYEFHRHAALMLTGRGRLQRQGSDFLSEEADQLESESVSISSPHSNLGRDYYGRSCCSCGKSFSTPFRLSEHIKQWAGTSSHPCTACGKVYKHESNLARHIATEHSHGREKCPGCGQRFDAEFLPKHLASGASACNISTTDICIADPDAMPQPWWIRGDDHIQPAMPFIFRDSGIDMDDEKPGQPMVDIGVISAPESCPTEMSCELCGERWRLGDDDFAQHLGQHSLDFAQKRYLCKACDIYFASQIDCDRHSQSVARHQHCGFNFNHSNDTCTGHHAPSRDHNDQENDHDLMQKHLWAWEQRQVQTHRSLVAKSLTERLSRPTDSAPSPVTPPKQMRDSVVSPTSNTSSPRNSDVSEVGSSHRVILDLGSEAIEGPPTSPRTAAIRNARDSLRTKSMKNIARLYKRKTGAELDCSIKSGSIDSMRPASTPSHSAHTSSTPMVAVA